MSATDSTLGKERTERIAFAMALRPGAEAEYRRRHADVWPEMLEALRAAGAHNYSIYIHGNDLIGVLDVEDFDRFRQMMDASPVNALWQADMAKLIDPCTDPQTGFHQRLEEVFHLD
jgi:L-rhamnose mutarotase